MNRTATLILDEEINQRYIFVGTKYNKLLGNDKGWSYVYTKEYADQNGIEYHVENWDLAKPGEFILTADKSHIVQVISKYREGSRMRWLRTSTRTHILNRKDMIKQPPDWIPAEDRYNFGGKKIPSNDLNRLNRKQIELAMVIAYNIMRTGKPDFEGAVKQVYDKMTTKRQVNAKINRIINRNIFQERIAMSMANLLRESGLTPEFTLKKIKEFIEDKDGSDSFRYGVLKDLMYMQGLPLKELDGGSGMDPRVNQLQRSHSEAIEAEYKEITEEEESGKTKEDS